MALVLHSKRFPVHSYIRKVLVSSSQCLSIVERTYVCMAYVRMFICPLCVSLIISRFSCTLGHS